MTQRPAPPTSPATQREAHECDRCGRPLRKVRYELYADRATRDDVQAKERARPIQVVPHGYVGTYGGICYYRHRAKRLELGQPSYRRVVRVDVG